MKKLKKLLLFYVLLNAAFFALLALLSAFVKDLNTGTIFPLMSPWLLFSISFFILAGDYEPAFLPAKKYNLISAVLRGAAIIAAYYCIGFHGDKTAFVCLLSGLAVIFAVNLSLDLLSVRVIVKHYPEAERIFKQNIETVTEDDVKNISNYRAAVGKSIGIVFGFTFSIGLLIGVGISLNLFLGEILFETAAFISVEILLIIYASYVSYRNLIARTKLFFSEPIKCKKRLRLELMFLTAANAVALVCAVIGFLDASIQFLPLIVSVALLVPIFKTNRRISIKIKLTEAKIRADNPTCSIDSENVFDDRTGDPLNTDNSSTEK